MRSRADGGFDRAMVIELAGAPGSGKTSLLPSVMAACEAVGLQPYTVEQAARAFILRTAVGRIAGQLPQGLRRRALWAVFAAGRMAGATLVAIRQPDLVRHIAHTQWRRPAAEVSQRRVIHWYVRMAGAHELLLRLAHRGEAVIVDEGFVHRAVQLHASGSERPTRAQIAPYIACVRPSDLLVVVHAPVAVCQRRVRTRGVWERLRHRSQADVDRFVANAHRAAELAAETARDLGHPMIEIDNTGDLAAAELSLKRRLEDILSERDDLLHRAPRPTPVARLPRPAHVVAGIVAHRRPAPIPEDVCAQILERYGLAPTSAPHAITGGRRNRNVVVATSAGPMVLRRYREATPRSTVRHEHAVLTELDRRAFPAVRLQRTPDDKTLVVHGGDTYALFTHAPGVNLSSYILLRRGALGRVTAVAGGTLARFHRELAHFRPGVPHHLGFHPDTGERIHTLPWYLETLGSLAARHPAVGPDGVRHHLAMVHRSRRLAVELTRLHELLEGAHLPRVMIHGDYGLHNLLFRRDGIAVVSDLELTRSEWRLVDLVIVLARLPFDLARELVDGYRREVAIPMEEWRHLADVWQYHRLTGAIHSWRNHFLYGGDQRLAAAHARVREADWARREVASLWR